MAARMWRRACDRIEIVWSERDDSDHHSDSGWRKRLKVTTEDKNLVDLSDGDGSPSRLLASPSVSAPSSPSRRPLGFKSGKKSIQHVWSTLKKLTPQRFKSRSKERRKNRLQNGGRLSSSHPDVSRNNLAALAHGSQDDMAVMLRSEERDGRLEDGTSRSDPNFLSGPGSSRGGMDEVHEPYTPSSFGDSVEGKSRDGWTTDQQDSLEAALNRQRLTALRQHAFFQLDVRLHSGKDLLAKDACGTSDPYVKFKVGNRQVYRSRTVPKTLEPRWDESFSIPVEDVFQPVQVRVYDYDFGFQDDFMGMAYLDLTKLDLNLPTDITLTLSETGKPEEETWGEITLTLTLCPKTQEEKEQFFNKGLKLGGVSGDALKRLKTQVWDSVVTIVLVEGKELLPMDENGLSDPYVKFRLGSEKYKSKRSSISFPLRLVLTSPGSLQIANKTLNPQWLEQFDLHVYADQPKILEITVWDRDYHGRDDFMGRCSINLSDLEAEHTHPMWKELEDGAGSIFLLLTISGTSGTETISDLTTYEPNPLQKQALINRYGLMQSFTNMRDIGQLIVKVYKAQGLTAADLGGKSDPFCVVELVNARLQTHTEYKTLSPEWNKIFTFQVKDIHSVLEITIYDEDRDKKFEFLGKVAIPLLKIRNGERRWYALKDKKLRSRAKGQILLELELVYNPIKASVRTFNPKETKFVQQEQKFKKAIFIRNVGRVKFLILEFYEIIKFVNSCFNWDSVPRSIIAFVIFLVITYTFELYMLPVTFLLIFLKNYFIYAVAGLQAVSRREEEEMEEDDDDDDDDEKDSKNKTLKEKLQTVQELTAMIQNVLGDIASFGERFKNTFNFTVPFLSWLAVIALLVATVILYFIPLRYLIMLWGINKFTKKLRNPHVVPNNEVMDFLSRVPDNDEKIMYRDFKPSASSTSTDFEKKKKKKIN